MLQDWVKKVLGVLVGVVVLYTIANIGDTVELIGWTGFISFTLMWTIGIFAMSVVLILLIDLIRSGVGD